MRAAAPYCATIAAALSIAGAGCAGSLLQSKAPAVQRYVLNPLPARPAQVQPLPVNVTVQIRWLSPGLSSRQVALVRNQREFDYYSATEWPDRLDAVVADLILKSLHSDRRLGSVSLQSPYSRAGYAVLIDVLDFQAEYPVAAEAATPVARVRLNVEVADLSARRVLTNFTVEASVEAAADTMTAIMAGFEAAFHDVVGRLANRAVQSITERESEQTLQVTE